MRLIFHDFEARHPAALIAAHVAIAEGSAGQCADEPRARSVPAAPPNPFEDFGAFIFGDHALNLQQKLILRRAADRAVQENDFGPSATKLVDQKNLMGMAPRQPVRRMDINAFDLPARHRVPQPLQRRTRQDRPAVAFILVAVVRLELETIGHDALA